MTLTAEFRSAEWELVLKYEDGSLPATQWNVETLTIVARWYAKNLDRDAETKVLLGQDPDDPTIPPAPSNDHPQPYSSADLAQLRRLGESQKRRRSS